MGVVLSKRLKSIQRKGSDVAVKAGNIGALCDLPLPPPPVTSSSSIESLDIAFLPPPPPEAFRGSTTSLDSLPPPPPPLDLTEECSWPSTSSLNSLPPPPSPQMTPTHENPQKARSPESPCKLLPYVPPKPRHGDRRMSEADLPQPPLPFLAELKRGVGSLSKASSKPSQRGIMDDDTWKSNQSGNSPPLGCPRTDRRSNIPVAPKTLNIIPNLPNQSVPPPPPPPAPPPPTSTIPSRLVKTMERPSPPTRNEDTKLSHNSSGLMRKTHTSATLPGRTASPVPCSPETFLRDLQKVMEKNGKVAQQLSVDLTATQVEILGFRDPRYLPLALSQTLGHPPPPPPPHATTMRPRSSSIGRQRNSFEDSATPKKRPPPPPPKRSETTQLSRR